MWILSLASLSGLRIWCCLRLECRSQTQLIPSVAVAVTWAGSCSSDLAPIHAGSICHVCGPKKKKKKKRRREKMHLKTFINSLNLLKNHLSDSYVIDLIFTVLFIVCVECKSSRRIRWVSPPTGGINVFIR